MIHTCSRLGMGLALLLLVARPVSADTFDLTGLNSSAEINDALFQQTFFQTSGTGSLESFLRIQQNGFEQGYNTDFRDQQSKTEFDEITDPNFTRSLLLSEVPIVTIDGVAYREFFLDLNEPTGNDMSLISLDQLQIFQGDAPDLHDYGLAESNLGTKIYDLDAGGDNTIILDADTNSGGSGKGDMVAYIPDSLFDPSIPYVYLYSAFGDDFGADGDSEATFEEWSVRKEGTPPVNEIPAPATLVFAALGCGCGLVGYLRRRRTPPTSAANLP